MTFCCGPLKKNYDTQQEAAEAGTVCSLAEVGSTTAVVLVAEEEPTGLSRVVVLGRSEGDAEEDAVVPDLSAEKHQCPE